MLLQNNGGTLCTGFPEFGGYKRKKITNKHTPWLRLRHNFQQRASGVTSDTGGGFVSNAKFCRKLFTSPLQTSPQYN
jgi:hypothetical protein